MKSHEIINQLQELREIWRKQDFIFTEGQKKTYDNLLKLRRERVKQFNSSDN
jgi:hypothetical protein